MITSAIMPSSLSNRMETQAAEKARSPAANMMRPGAMKSAIGRPPMVVALPAPPPAAMVRISMKIRLASAGPSRLSR
jgi:hypothetical protein